MWRWFGTSADTAIVDLVQLDTQTRWQQRWHQPHTRKMYPVTPFENHCIFVLLHAIVITSVVQRSSSSLSSSLIRGRTRPRAQAARLEVGCPSSSLIRARAGRRRREVYVVLHQGAWALPDGASGPPVPSRSRDICLTPGPKATGLKRRHPAADKNWALPDGAQAVQATNHKRPEFRIHSLSHHHSLRSSAAKLTTT